VRKEKSMPVQLEQNPSHLSLLYTQLSLAHQGLLVCSGLLGRRVVWVPMRSCACLHTWWKYRVWLGVWAFFDRSGSASAYMSQMYSSWILWIGEKASSLLLLGCNKEKKLWIGIFFLWKIFKVLRASQEAASAFAVSLICNGWNNGCVVFAEHQSELPTCTWRMMAPKSTCPQEGMLQGAS
jgi:hypothetical protein